MTKHPYTADELAWKPRRTRLRRLIAWHIEQVMEKQARLHHEIERKRAELAYLNELQGEFRKWDEALGLISTPEQLNLLLVEGGLRDGTRDTRQ